jgi:hypothetical protein
LDWQLLLGVLCVHLEATVVVLGFTGGVKVSGCPQNGPLYYSGLWIEAGPVAPPTLSDTVFLRVIFISIEKKCSSRKEKESGNV